MLITKLYLPDNVLIQVKECLKQNEELRGMLDKLRTEQINIMSSNGGQMINGSSGTNNHGGSDTGSDEILNLKVSILYSCHS